MAVTAKYPAVCGVCSSAIVPGAEIVKVEGRWAHRECAAGGAGALFDAPGGRAGRATTPAVPTGRSVAGAGRGPAAVPSGALEVWTDGACSGNPGPGGWAWATRDGRQASGGESATTNQRMEIRAVLEAVTVLDGPLVVVSDSTYVVNCFRDSWWRGWLARGWTNSAKRPVANQDLWEPLITVYRNRNDIAFRWVKGHSGDTMNDLVDRLAVEASRTAAG